MPWLSNKRRLLSDLQTADKITEHLMQTKEENRTMKEPSLLQSSAETLNA